MQKLLKAMGNLSFLVFFLTVTSRSLAAPERQANLGDLFGMMGGLMSAMAPEEDAKEIQQQMGEITQLLGGIGLAPAGPDSADVSLDLNAGAETPTGLFSEPVDACLQYFNNEVISGITLEECKEKCSSATSFVCHSLDYEGAESRCLLSEESKKTQPSSYKEPCYDGTHSTYLEQIFTDSADVSLDLNVGTEASTAAQPTGLFSDPVDGCLKSFNHEVIDGITLEECKEKCSSATSYVCHSLEYEQRCLLSEESKKTQPRSYKEPCYDGTHSTYLEQIFTDSANVSLDLNAGAEASTAAQPTGLFSEPVDACLQYFNNEVIDGITLEECKEKCSSATSFVCHSLEYEQRCLLSEESKKTQPRSYTEPCYDGTHSTYLEQIFTDSADVSLDLNAGAEGSSAAQQQDGCYEEDTDYYGNDINMNTGRNEDRKESPAECQELCTQTEGCKFFTWKQYSKECWSKTVGGYGKGHHEIGSVSGPRNCDSADVSLDLNTDAIGSTGLFSDPVDACLQYNNNEAISGITLEQCKEKCASATSFICRSLDYEGFESPSNCFLSAESKKTQPSAYFEPCYDGTHSTYLEQIFTDSADVYLDLNTDAIGFTGLFSDPVDACLQYNNNEAISGITLEQCKEKCASATSFLCRSLDYEGLESPSNCFLSAESKKTQPSAYSEPCYDGTHSTYLEQIFTGYLDSARASSQLESSAHCWGGGSWCIWGPQFAIDGIIQTTYGKIFHSNLENYPWFEVELRNSTEISSVTIYNRPDCCGERFKNAEIRAGMTRVPDGTIGQLLNINTICGTYAGPGSNGEEMRIDCGSPIMAKFITVQLKDINAILQINEIRINING